LFTLLLLLLLLLLVVPLYLLSQSSAGPQRRKEFGGQGRILHNFANPPSLIPTIYTTRGK